MATTFFWVMTVQAEQRTPGAVALFTFNGTAPVQPGETRQGLYRKVTAYVADQLERAGQPRGHNVLFYSAEPNQI